MIDRNTQVKIEFSGTIRSVQPRSNVWRYRLDNRTHSMTGYNHFIHLIHIYNDLKNTAGNREGRMLAQRNL